MTGEARRLGWLRNGNPPADLATLQQCGAHARTTGKPCRQPAMRNGRCRLHGGKSTGAPGNRNALKHGRCTRAAIARRRLLGFELRRIARDLRELERQQCEAARGGGKP